MKAITILFIRPDIPAKAPPKRKILPARYATDRLPISGVLFSVFAYPISRSELMTAKKAQTHCSSSCGFASSYTS
jgi:hypothetical protein